MAALPWVQRLLLCQQSHRAGSDRKKLQLPERQRNLQATAFNLLKKLCKQAGISRAPAPVHGETLAWLSTPSPTLNQAKSKEDLRLNSGFPNEQKQQKRHIFPAPLLGKDEKQAKRFPSHLLLFWKTGLQKTRSNQTTPPRIRSFYTSEGQLLWSKPNF